MNMDSRVPFERGVERRTISDFIREIANKAYFRVAEKYRDYLTDPRPEAVYMEGDKCQQVSEQAYDILSREMKIPTQYVDVDDKDFQKQHGARHHVYLLVGGKYLFDGTWQSFLDEIRKDNKYLFLRVDSLEQDLAAAKVPQELWPLWQNYKNYVKQNDKQQTKKAA